MLILLYESTAFICRTELLKHRVPILRICRLTGAGLVRVFVEVIGKGVHLVREKGVWRSPGDPQPLSPGLPFCAGSPSLAALG